MSGVTDNHECVSAIVSQRFAVRSLDHYRLLHHAKLLYGAVKNEWFIILICASSLLTYLGFC